MIVGLNETLSRIQELVDDVSYSDPSLVRAVRQEAAGRIHDRTLNQGLDATGAVLVDNAESTVKRKGHDVVLKGVLDRGDEGDHMMSLAQLNGTIEVGGDGSDFRMIYGTDGFNRDKARWNTDGGQHGVERSFYGLTETDQKVIVGIHEEFIESKVRDFNRG